LPAENFIFVRITFAEMGKMNFDNGVFKILRNKWIVTSMLFLTWIIFFDENSIVSHQKNKRRLYELKQQEDYYRERIEVDKQKLEDLKAGEEKLEKFAREQYFMSKPDEDVFVVVEDD
jgi:cell division protein FtsB